MSQDLNQRLLDAHARHDRAALVQLYKDASDHSNSEDAKYFYLTHAYIFALDSGHPLTSELHALLKTAGRES
jgi:hypothetical protein